MELSHHKTRPITVLDLPEDILYNIFDYFQDDHVIVQNKVTWITRDKNINLRRTIQSTRLVCRRFHQLASPLLCPTLRVKLDQTSLDLVKDISRSPLIAAGVRDILVVLDYRPRELAADLSQFKDLRKKDLDKISARCYHYFRSWSDCGYDRHNWPQPMREYCKAMDYYSSLCLASDDCCSPADGSAKDADSVEYQRVFVKAMKSIGKSTRSKFNWSRTDLSLTSSRHQYHRYLDKYWLNPTVFLNNMEELSRHMATPQDWRTIEELEGGAELVPAKILSELLIAIHKAGTTLREIHISSFPLTSNYSMICPDRHDQLNPAWTDLHAACQHLEKFEFPGGSRKPIRYNHLLAEEQTFVDKCFGAILSGQSLEVVKLNFWDFCLNDGCHGAKGSYRIGSVLGATNWPRLKLVTISNVSLGQGELEKSCSRLGYRWEMIYLYNIELLSGSWAGALDILREKVLSRRLDRKCSVSFRSLTGGEFGEEKKKTVKFEPLSIHTLSKILATPEHLIVVLSQKYVLGEVAENPLNGGLVGEHKKVDSVVSKAEGRENGLEVI